MSEARLEYNGEQGRRIVRIAKENFTIGRRSGNDLQLEFTDVSRDHAEIVILEGRYILRDKASRFGTFVNGQRCEERTLEHLDRLSFGAAEPEVIFFREEAVHSGGAAGIAVSDLRQISSLLEALRGVGSSRVLEDVLALVLDTSIDLAGAERGFIMLANAEGSLEFKLARARGRQTLDGGVFKISRKIPDGVFFTGQAQIIKDMFEGDWADAHGATVAMGIRNVLCTPLRLVRYSEEASEGSDERRIGVLYLDSRDRGALDSEVTRTALEALAREAAVAIENTRLYREALDKVRLEQELKIAADMQQSLLPARRRCGKHYEIAGAMVPCLAIGGDFFDYFEMPDGRLGIVLCDVSGKGAPAALLTALIQGVFRGGAEDSKGPASSIARVNSVLAHREVKERYATSFYCTLGPDGSFAYCNAGHCPPILVRADGSEIRLDKGGMPVGMFGPARYEQDEFQLSHGDTLLIFSDGLSEAENTQSEEFGEDQLAVEFQAVRQLDPGAILEALTAKVKSFAGTHPQMDDMTGVVVRYLPKS